MDLGVGLGGRGVVDGREEVVMRWCEVFKVPAERFLVDGERERAG
jgi:hypothetical protein